MSRVREHGIFPGTGSAEPKWACLSSWNSPSIVGGGWGLTTWPPVMGWWQWHGLSALGQRWRDPFSGHPEEGFMEEVTFEQAW